MVAHSYTIICVLGFIVFMAFFTSHLVPVYADDGSHQISESFMGGNEILDSRLEAKTGAPV